MSRIREILLNLLPIAGILLLAEGAKALFGVLPPSIAAHFDGPNAFVGAVWATLFGVAGTIGLVKWLQVVARELRAGPPRWPVVDVSAGPHKAVRAPAAEAQLRAAGWRPLSVLRYAVPVEFDVLWWVSPAGDAFAES